VKTIFSIKTSNINNNCLKNNISDAPKIDCLENFYPPKNCNKKVTKFCNGKKISYKKKRKKYITPKRFGKKVTQFCCDVHLTAPTSIFSGGAVNYSPISYRKKRLFLGKR
jgi:hypothetical protein